MTMTTQMRRFINTGCTLGFAVAIVGILSMSDRPAASSRTTVAQHLLDCPICSKESRDWNWRACPIPDQLIRQERASRGLKD